MSHEVETAVAVTELSDLRGERLAGAGDVDVFEVEAELLEEAGFAGEVRDAVEVGADALAGDALEVVDLGAATPAAPARRRWPRRWGVRSAFEAAGAPQHVRLGVAVERDHVGDGQFAFRQRARLVDGDGVDRPIASRCVPPLMSTPFFAAR